MTPGSTMLTGLPGILSPGLIFKVLGHHGEPADPTLLVWIKHRLDQLLDLGPWTVVVLLGLVLVAIPVVMMAVYWSQRSRIPPALPWPPEKPSGNPSGDSAS